MISSPQIFELTKEQLLLDLYQAYRDARKHKRSRLYQLEFEYRLEDNLVKLRDELWYKKYIPASSKCFIIHEPKMREIFAASFRDRIVHHLLFNYIHELCEKTFIYDCYSCIKGRGVHFGVARLEHHIRSVSHGYTEPCFVLKLDIRGYFMSINRSILLTICKNVLDKYKYRVCLPNNKRYIELFDYKFIEYLMDTLIMLDPTLNCKVIGNIGDWKKIPKEKTLFGSNRDCGLPIGNLTSQLFSNVYLNALDQFAKRTLKCNHYGRYVDDIFIVSQNKKNLQSIIIQIDRFLSERLCLSLNYNKTRIYDAYYGVPFLGSYLMPFRRYIENSTLRRIQRNLIYMKFETPKELQARMNSYLGVMSHSRCLCIRRCIISKLSFIAKYGNFSSNCLKFIPF